jgi:hypothetical protein
MKQKSLSEKETTYNPTYPNNQVEVSPNGLVFEKDSTPGNTRYSFFHPSGSFFEYQHDGFMVEKIVNDKHEIIEGNVQNQYKKNVDATIKGNESRTSQNYLHVVEQNYDQITLKNYTIKVGGDYKSIVGGARTNQTAKTQIDIANAQDLRAGTDKPSFLIPFKQGSFNITGTNVELHSADKLFASSLNCFYKTGKFTMDAGNNFSIIVLDPTKAGINGKRILTEDDYNMLIDIINGLHNSSFPDAVPFTGLVNSS